MLIKFCQNTKTFQYIKTYGTSAFILILIFLFSACAYFSSGSSKTHQDTVINDPVALFAEKDNIQKAYNNFAFAVLKMSEGKYDESRKYLSDAIENNPESVYLQTKMAILLKNMKKFQEAYPYALKGVTLDPENINCRILLGDLYSLTEKEDLAVEQYEKALSLEPENQRVRLLIATILIRKNQLTQALDHLHTLTEKNPASAIGFYYIGKINMALKKYEDAEKAFLEVLKLKEGQESAMIDLGELYQETERYEKAVNIYEYLLEYYPTNTAVRVKLANIYNKLGLAEKASQQMEIIKENAQPGDPSRQTLGLIYLKQGKLDESIEELNVLISVWPEDQKTRYYLAVAYQEKGDFEKAFEHFSMIKQESKYFSDAQMHLAYILLSQNKNSEAETILERTILINKNDIEPYLMLANIYENKKEYGHAIKVIRDGLQQNERNIDLMFRLGVLLDKSGNKKSCLEQMEKIVEMNPEHADALNYVGYTYAEQGIKLDKAMEMIKKALIIQPNSGYIIDSLGWIYFQKGQYDEAIRHLEKSTSLTPDDPTINEHLGDAYFKKKEYQKALKCYEKAVSLDAQNVETLKKKIEETIQIINQDR